MQQRTRERGNSAVNLLFALIFVAVLAVLILQFLPAQYRRSELLDFMEEQTKTAGRTPAQKMEERLYEKARELKVPIDKKNVKVVVRGDNVRLTASYTETLDFMVFKHDWDIDLEVDRPIFKF